MNKVAIRDPGAGAKDYEKSRQLLVFFCELLTACDAHGFVQRKFTIEVEVVNGFGRDQPKID